MKFAYIDQKYLNFLSEKDSHVQNETFGLLAYREGLHIFIPISSKYKKFEKWEPNHIKDNYYEIIKDTAGKNIAVLKIRDYIISDVHSLNTYVELTPFIRNEYIYINKNVKKIENKIDVVLKFHKRVYEKRKKWSKEYYAQCKPNRLIYKKMAQSKVKHAIRSMSLVEGIDNYVEFVPEIIANANIPLMNQSDEIDVFSIHQIKNLHSAWRYMVETLSYAVDVDYLIKLHKLVADGEALYTGKLREQPSYVSGKHRIDTVSEKDLERKIVQLLSKDTGNSEYLHRILELYVYLIVTQPFVDGNKRTAFIILNKLLLQNEIGMVIIKDHQVEDYDRLLSACYENNNKDNLYNFIKFIKDDCLVY